MEPPQAALDAARALKEGTDPEGVVDVVIVGAGPAGLVTAQAAWEAGLSFLVLERENLAAHWRRYPGDMKLLSTVEETELPGLGLATAKTILSRQEAIDYFVSYARRLGLDRFVVPRTEVTSVDGEAGAFTVHAKHAVTGAPRRVKARIIILATGAFSVPKPLGVPGEDRATVRRWFGAGADHVGENVVVIGAGNSAAEAVVELVDLGAASVTMLVRAPAWRFYSESGDLLDIREGSEARLRQFLKEPVDGDRFKVVFDADVVAVEDDVVRYRTPAGEGKAPAHWVYALTGYGFDERLLKTLAVPVADGAPVLSEDLETERPGVYVAGARWLIQNFREDGRIIVAHALVHHVQRRR